MAICSCSNICDAFCDILKISAILGATMAAVGTIAGEYIIPGMNAAQGAALLGFTGLIICPTLSMIVSIVDKCISSVENNRKEHHSGLAKALKVFTSLFVIIGVFFASVAVASLILPETGLKATSFSDAFIAGGVSLGIVVGVPACIGGCIYVSKKMEEAQEKKRRSILKNNIKK